MTHKFISLKQPNIRPIVYFEGVPINLDFQPHGRVNEVDKGFFETDHDGHAKKMYESEDYGVLYISHNSYVLAELVKKKIAVIKKKKPIPENKLPGIKIVTRKNKSKKPKGN